MRLSLSAVVFLGILITALVAATIAFVPTYQSGVDGVDKTVVIVRQNVIARVDNGVRLFFEAPKAAAASWANYAAAGYDILSDRPRMLNFACRALRDFSSVARSITVATPTYQQLCDLRFGQPMAVDTFNTPDRIDAYLYNLTGLEYIEPRQLTLSLPFNISSDWLFRLKMSSTDQWWLNAYAGYSSVQLTIAAPLVDTSGTLIGRIAADIFPEQITVLLNSLGLTKGSRAFVIDWPTQRIIGNNWGQDSQVLLTNWADLSLRSELRMIFLTFATNSDPLIRRVTDALGGAPGIEARGDRFAETLFSGSDRTYVDVATLTDDHGLHIKYLVAQPEEDFLGEIRDSQRTTLGAVGGSLAAMLIATVLFAILLARPLKRLANRMYLTASLQDDGEDDPPSMISEIASMQEAYSTMRSELTRMKSYLPQSLLQRGDDTDEDETDDAVSSINPSTKSGRPISVDNQSHHSMSGSSARSSRTGDRLVSSKVAGGGLAMSRSLNRKRVTIAVFNAANFHEAVGGNDRNLRSTQNRILEAVSAAANENKGIVDMFHGDRVVVSFNAVTNCASNGKRAVTAALAAKKALEESLEASTNATPMALSVGISSGNASVGNMGLDSMCRFNVVGSVYPEAHVIERFARSQMRPATCSETYIAASATTAVDTALEFIHEFVEIIHTSSVESPKLIARVLGPKSMGLDEWMYQIEEGQRDDPFAAVNDAFVELLEEHFENAALIANALSEEKYASAKATLLRHCNTMELHKSAAVVPAHGTLV